MSWGRDAFKASSVLALLQKRIFFITLAAKILPQKRSQQFM